MPRNYVFIKEEKMIVIEDRNKDKSIKKKVNQQTERNINEYIHK